MKKKLVALMLSMLTVLTACGTPSGNASSGNEKNKPGSAASNSSTQDNDGLAAGSGETDSFLKEITGDTAEAQGVCGADLNWYYKDNVLVIRGTGAMTEYSGSDVPWNDYRDKINRVIIDEGCTALCNGLFQGYKYLSSVVLPDSLTEIGERTFSNCGELVSVHLGNGITSTGLWTFEQCNKLKAIQLPKSLSAIGAGTFWLCENLADVEIPDSVTEIGNSAFSCCYSLESITIPDRVTKIGSSAFARCDSLTALTIPSNVKELGVGIFNESSKLKNVDIKTPDYVLENDMLFNREKTVLLGALVSDLNTYTVPDGVVEITDSALYGLDNLRVITFPANVKKIGNFMNTIDEEGAQYTLTFLGDAPEGLADYIARSFNISYSNVACTIYYSGNGFEEALADAEYQGYDGNIEWIKQ